MNPGFQIANLEEQKVQANYLCANASHIISKGNVRTREIRTLVRVT